MTAPSWGNSTPFLFDLRGNGVVYLVCVECLAFQRDITGLYVDSALGYATDHIAAAHSG